MDALELMKRLLAAANTLADLGLATLGPAKGSISARDVDTGRVFVTPSGKNYREVTPETIVELAPDGIPTTPHKPSVDSIFHLAIYAARPEIGCVVHLHSPFSTTFAVCHAEIPVYMQAVANTVGCSVPVAEFALPGTKELGENIVKAMDGWKNAVLMANHGLVACAPTPEEAVIIASTVEVSAQVAYQSIVLGNPVALTQAEIDGARGFYARQFLGSGH